MNTHDAHIQWPGVYIESNVFWHLFIAAATANYKTLDFWEWHNVTWHINFFTNFTNTHFILFFFIYSSPKESVQAEQSRKGSRWDKPVSSGHILKSGITLAVWWCSQNTLSSLQHLIKGLLIFSWWSRPSQHLAASTPHPFPAPHNPVKKHTSWHQTDKLAHQAACPPWTQQKKFPLNVLVQNLRKEVLKKEGNIISMKGF